MSDKESFEYECPEGDMCPNKERINQLEKQNKVLREALAIWMPSIEALYWDDYSAGNIPGSGYSHKAYNKIPFDWRNSEKFEKWLSEANNALKQCDEVEG